VAFSHQPISCFLATQQGRIIGFACYESTWKNFFGPMGVAEHARRQGIGTALLLACLHAMAAQGYAYAIIGNAADLAFYTQTVGAIAVEGSEPGIYRDRLHGPGH
jgi:GNAT superfamily N-acetyltransferase